MGFLRNSLHKLLPNDIINLLCKYTKPYDYSMDDGYKTIMKKPNVRYGHALCCNDNIVLHIWWSNE